jgi:hypothetical protein
MPLVLSFTGTGHTVARGWNMLIANALHPVTKKKLHLWIPYYRVKTRLRQRGEQSWYLLDVSHMGERGKPYLAPTQEDADRGRSLHESLAKGERQVNFAESGDDDDNIGTRHDDRM